MSENKDTKQSAKTYNSTSARARKQVGRGDRKLEQRIADLEQQVTELSGDVKRERADFMNYRRRSELDRAQIMETATMHLMSQLLPLFDDLERALAAVPDDIADNPWAKGIAQVYRQVQAKLDELGVNRIDCMGQSFDPNLHEAVGFEDGEGSEEVVIEELRPGYRIGDTILRPSMVKVGRLDNDNKSIKEDNNG